MHQCRSKLLLRQQLQLSRPMARLRFIETAIVLAALLASHANAQEGGPPNLRMDFELVTWKTSPPGSNTSSDGSAGVPFRIGRIA